MSDVIISFGSGTEDDPYLVDTVKELREKAKLSSVYIKVVKDLDCNTENYLHWETISSNAHIDLDGHAILNVLISDGNYCFRNTTISNGYFLNCYTESTMPFLFSCQLYRVGVKGFQLPNARQAFIQDCNMDECNIKITNYSKEKTTMPVRFEYRTSNMNVAKNTLFTIKSYYNPCIFYSYTNYSNVATMMYDCKVEAEFINISEATSIFYYRPAQVSLNTCMIVLDYPSVPVASGDNYLWGTSTVSTAVNCVVVKDKLPDDMKIPPGATFITDEQARNPDYLNSIEFIVAEV